MKKIKTILTMLSVVTVISTPGFAVEYFLRADIATKTMPDGNVIPMWGFALDSAFGALDGNVTVPGPFLTVPPGDQELIIHLDNNLNVPVSIIINGQITNMTPVRLPEDINRVRSFTHETEPNNSAPVDYVWTNFREGTYAYQSGTHIAVQVQMGLYGGVTKDYAAGQIYQDSNTAFDVSVPLFFSEIDPSLHNAVASGDYGPDKGMTSTIDYEPKYFLINGQSFVPGTAVLPVGNAGDTVLLRLFNMGLETRCPLLLGKYMTLIAEDGHKYQYPKQQYVALLTAGKTIDALVTFQSDGVYPIYDRRLGMTTSQMTGGGMLAYLSIGGVLPPKVTATPASILDTQTSQLQVVATDTGGPLPLTYYWTVPAGGGSVSNRAIANPVYTPPGVNGFQVFTLKVSVFNGQTTVFGSVDINVTEDTTTPPISAASILVTKTAVKAGTKANSDSISISGQMEPPVNDFNNGGVIEVNIDSNYIVNPLVETFPIDAKTFKNGKYHYSKTVNGVKKSFSYSVKTHKFTFAASKVNLSGLDCPIDVNVKIGDYLGHAELSETIVNGPKKPIPIKLLMGVKDSLRVDKIQLKRSTDDTLKVKGGFAVKDTTANIAAGDIVADLSGQTFTIPGASIKVNKNKDNFTCSNAKLGDGSIVSANFNVRKCTFTMTIKNTKISSGSGTGNFNVKFTSSGFNEAAGITLPWQQQKMVHMGFVKQRLFLRWATGLGI